MTTKKQRDHFAEIFVLAAEIAGHNTPFLILSNDDADLLTQAANELKHIKPILAEQLEKLVAARNVAAIGDDRFVKSNNVRKNEQSHQKPYKKPLDSL